MHAAGFSDAAVAAELDIPRRTVSDWRRGVLGKWHRCPRCGRRTRTASFTSDAYAELLGLYLGDGHIVSTARTQRLRISLDARYPGVVEATRRLLAEALPESRVGLVRADGGATAVVSVYFSHLSCLLPQHGAGKKHHREVPLEP